jgi:HAD superfamily hydrolase (TIGR01509 family)
MTATPIELIIFDCDGVLVDSERITNRIFAQMLNELGLPLTLDDMFERFVGNSMSHCLELIGQMLGKPPPSGFVEEYHLRTKLALETDLKPIPGIEEALADIRIPYCVASSGDHNKMRATLGITKLWPKFEGRLFSITEVPRGKPYPDVFLFAAERFGVAPASCAVVEDTPIGVVAGVAAGMRVFGYAAATPKRRLSDAGAHIVFDDMRKLPALLRTSFHPDPT